jgi:hypothetical protein
MPDVMRRLVERGLPELVVAGAAGDPDVAHAPAAFGSFPGRRADAGLPAHLGAAGPELMTERAKLGLVFENRYRHENDHAQAGGISVLPDQAVAATALQARCLEAVARRSVDAASCVVPVPASIDAAIARSYLERKYPVPPR